MINTLSKLGLLAVVITMISACASSPFYHQNFMRGQVVSVDGDSAIICIGSYQNELQGQSLVAYRIVNDESVLGTDDGPEFQGYYRLRREYAGVIVIETIIDEHFARATIVEGQISKHDMVELSR